MANTNKNNGNNANDNTNSNAIDNTNCNTSNSTSNTTSNTTGNKAKRCALCGNRILPSTRGLRSSFTKNCICKDCMSVCRGAIRNSDMTDKLKWELELDLEVDDEYEMPVPKELKEMLDEVVIGQDEAKKSLAVAVYNHYKRTNMKSSVKLAKSNVLLIGPTGSGKTLLAQTIAKILDVPFAIADCTALTEAGYVGDDVESVLSKLLVAADDNIEKAEKGIVFLDEIDKLAARNKNANITKDPSGEGVQQGLLKLIEGTEVSVPVRGTRKNPNVNCVSINTENILFICGGAFPGLEELIYKRTNTKTKSIGFCGNVETEENEPLSDVLKKVTTEDLKNFGLLPEFTGRLPIIVTLCELDEDAMVDILTKPKNSIVEQYKEYFRYDGVELEFTKAVLKEIARESLKRGTGARGLRGILEEVLKEHMYVVPSETGLTKCIVRGMNDVKYVYEQKAAS